MYGEISRPGCVVFGHGPLGKPVTCNRPPTHAGLLFFEHPHPRVWRVFACDVHADELIAARPMLERDRDELQRRVQARQRGIDGGGGAVRVEPLAVGGEARRLVVRAREWAARHARRGVSRS